MSFKETLLVTCDSPGCQASAQIEMSDRAEVNNLLKTNKWMVDGTSTHTCPWCQEAGIQNIAKATA